MDKERQERTAKSLLSTVLITTLALTATAVAAKMATALSSVFMAGAPESLAGLWLLGTGGDALMALFYAMAAWFVCARRAVSGRPMAARAAHAVLIALSSLLMLYLLLNVHLYQLLGTPLNIRYLEWTGGQGTDITSALKEEPPFVSGGLILAALIIVPLLLTVVRRKLLKGQTAAWLRRALARTVLVLAIWGVGLGAITLIPSLRTHLGTLRLNPVLAFVQSSLEAMTDRSDSYPFTIDPQRPTYFDATSPFPEVDREPGCPITRPEKPVKNVVLFVMESWTAQDQQLFGGGKPNTPNLKRLEPHTLRMERYYAPSPVSIKALFNIFCSMYPYPEFKFITTVNPRIACDALPEVLARHDYHSALFHGGKFMYTNKLAFFDDRGFELLMDAISIPKKHGYFTYGWGIEDRAMVDQAIKWIDRKKRRPFFVTFIPIIPHYPYVIPDDATPRFSTKTLKSRYHNGIAYLDEQVGRLYDELDARGIADETLFVIVADHGQAFYQHPHNRMHANFLYQENTWVPLYLINKRLFQGGPSCDRISTHIDLAPTILDALGLEVPERYQGRTLFEEGPPHMALLSTMYRDKLIGVRDGPYKYILNLETGAVELYDLEKDPGEKENIAFQHAERTEVYRNRLMEWREFQRYLIENYSSVTGHRPVDHVWEAMKTLLHRSRVWLEHEGSIRPCDILKDMGDDSRHWRYRVEGWRCQDAKDWMYAGMKYLTVDGRWSTCIRLHPPEQGKMRISMPLDGQTDKMSGRAAIQDVSVKAGGKPVTLRFSLDGKQWSSIKMPNKIGYTDWQAVGPGTSLEIELSASNWRNRTVCLIIDVPTK
ncbi:MAG: sulfatase-like hydrolase/transferase [Deltaproteobacteria bacterium]|nr:sulfatase-like hydrolase/transferase [Deltaproteobacteria bacterium]